MEGGPDGTSSGGIRGTSQQIAGASTPVVGASPVARIPKLKGPEATPQVATVVRHQNVVIRKIISDDGTDLQGKTIEEMELKEFEAFKSFRAMRKLQSQRQPQKEKEWDRVSVHTDQTEYSDEQGKESTLHEKRSSMKERDAGRPSNAKDTHKRQEKYPKVAEAKQYNQAFKNQTFRSPFTDDINEISIPKGLKGPRVPPYDGTGDPDDHVSNFQLVIKMLPMDLKLSSLNLAGTLYGSARYWLAS
ncbi:unnamed protein product [Lactuca virosa]|uniref:Reverse transcriptase domain-containing protein n=1 Tax=Lactuca virosa TaxID=75947 RepID=A0AAU9M1A1_9ASTR|nr:unnamed protein product [Lactuca virosa]